MVFISTGVRTADLLPDSRAKVGLFQKIQRMACISHAVGNQEYLSSASHGCGRRMGRKEAKRSLNLEELKGQMAGIVSTSDITTLDEAPGAYKDINAVITYQESIVIEVIFCEAPDQYQDTGGIITVTIMPEPYICSTSTTQSHSNYFFFSAFFIFLSAFFSFGVLAGAFFSVFLLSSPLLIICSLSLRL
jgi:hypothetical protein